MKHGLHIEYSNVNVAYSLMWHDQVLRIGSKADMQWEMDILLRGVTDGES